jgi:hypothetical protein
VSPAWAESVSSGEGGSITIQAVDPATGDPIPDGLLQPGMTVKLVVHAYDSGGNRIGCTPIYGVNQGVTGNQIEGGVDPAAATFKMGQGFGSASVNVRCQELPNVKSELNVRNNPPMTPPTTGAKQEAPAEAAGGGGGGAGTALAVGLIIGAGIAGGLLLASALSESSGSDECSTRTCIQGISCSCSGSTSTTCDDGLPVVGSGSTCTSGNTRVAWCSTGLTCVNGTCRCPCS